MGPPEMSLILSTIDLFYVQFYSSWVKYPLRYPHIERKCPLLDRLVWPCSNFLPPLRCSWSWPRHQIVVKSGELPDFIQSYQNQFETFNSNQVRNLPSLLLSLKLNYVRSSIRRFLCHDYIIFYNSITDDVTVRSNVLLDTDLQT